MTSIVPIEDVPPYVQSIATSLQTVFDTPFTADDDTDVVVYARADGAEPDDAADLVSDADYTITYIGVDEIVRVTFDTGRTLNDVVTIMRATPVERLNLYTNTNFTTSMLNGDFGKQTMMIQEREYSNNNLAPKYNNNATVNPNPSFPNADTILPILGAEQTWVKNAGDTAIIVADFPADGAASKIDTYVTITDETANEPNSFPLSAIGDGLMVNRTGTEDVVVRTLSGTSNEIEITNGDGVSGNPTIGIVDNPVLGGTAGMGIPQGTTAQRVTPLSGIGLRYNTDLNQLEYYDSGWIQLEDSTDIATLLALLASHTAAEGASLIGLEDQGAVSSKTVQDLAEAGIIAKTDNGTLVNGQFLAALSTGMLRSTTTTGVLSIDAVITALSNLSYAADKLAYSTGATSFSLTDLTAFARTLLDDSNAATAAATLEVLPLSGGTMTGNIDMGGFKVTNATTPTVGSDYTTKTYVDNIVANVHPACDLASTVNLAGYTYDNGTAGVGATLTAGGVGVLTVDSVATVLGDRLLIKNQTSELENGVYEVTTEGTAGVAAILTRATDYDQAADMQAGDKFPVVQGTLFAATEWMMTQTAAITVGTTAITFVEMSSTGALLIANNLSDLDDTTTSRTNLGVEIGVDVQAYDAGLQSIAGLTTIANSMLYTTAFDTYDVIAPANDSVMISSAAGVPSWSTSLPSGLTIPGYQASGNYALSGANADITSMTGLTGALQAPTGVDDTNGNEVVTFTGVASAVNEIDISNAATGGDPTISATGGDTDITLKINSKGTGRVSIEGTSTNDSPDAGYVGEVFESKIEAASAVSVTFNTVTNITSISLEAGDWDVWGNLNCATMVTSPTQLLMWISNTDATITDSAYYSAFQTTDLVAPRGVPVPYRRFSLASTTTIYLSCRQSGASGTGSMSGTLTARRAS